MPELPEVEILARQLRSQLLGARILSADLSETRVIKTPRQKMALILSGRRIESISRIAKFIVWNLEGEYQLWFHLGMTGSFSFNEISLQSPYRQAVFHLDRLPKVLVFSDIRKFGRLFLTSGNISRLMPQMGPEPFGLTPEEFTNRFSSRTGRIKSLLLNQKIISGLGNIYADESLFRAGIDPRRRANRIKDDRLKILHRHICRVLHQAIRCGGSSIDDFHDINGRSGRFQSRHQVYGRHEKACRHCTAKIKRIWISGRSAHFCPSCQK